MHPKHPYSLLTSESVLSSFFTDSSPFPTASEPASILSTLLPTTPESVTRPCSTMIWIGGFGIDAMWNDFTAPHEGKSDGVVQGSSQVYPGGAVNYTIPGGDSHLGEPKSDRTRPVIEQAFNVNFNVPKP